MRRTIPVSVLIPAYNVEAFLDATIATVRAQSVDVESVIVVDDASTDGTAALAERLGAHVVHAAHGGPAAARNAGLAQARSEWIATLDADDVWHPRKLELQYEAATANAEVGLVFTDWDAVSMSDGEILKANVVSDYGPFAELRKTALTNESSLLDFAGFLALPARSIVLPSTTMFRRDTALAVGGFPENVRAEDTEFFMRLASHTRTAFVNVPLVAYMRHSSQITANWELDPVRIELYRHVMTNRQRYHERLIEGWKKEYSNLLYFSSANAAAKGQYRTSAALLAKAAAVAAARGTVPSLVRTAARSRTVRSTLRRPDAQTRLVERILVGASCRPFDIPWRYRYSASSSTPAPGGRLWKAASFVRNFGRASSGSMAVAQAFIVKLVMLAINLGTGILSARILGPTGRAEQAAMMLGVGLFPAVLSFGLPIAVQFRLKTSPGSQERLISTATVLSILFGTLCFLVSIFALPRLIAQYPPDVIRAAQLFMLAAPFTVIFNVFNGVLQARSKFAQANFSQYAPLVAALVVLGALAVVHRLTPVTSAATYVVTSVLAACWLWTVVGPKISLAGFRDTAARLLSFGLRSYVTDILGIMQIQIDTLLVINLLSPRSMGLYAIALSAARLSDLFSGAIVTVLFPKAAALPKQAMLDLTNRVGRLTLALIAPIVALNMLTLPFLLPAFFGKEFAAAVPVAQVLSLTFILNGTGYVISQAFVASGRPGIIAIIQAAGLAFVVPLMLFLIPRYGLIGAAWALVLATLLRTVITAFCFPLALKAPIPSFIVKPGDLRFVRESLAQRFSKSDA